MSRKHSIEEVREIYEKSGYELISEYKDVDTVLFVKDREGYICSGTLKHFKENHLPSRFHSANPYTIQNIKTWIKNNNINGYELLSDKYNNCDEDLLFKCECNHEFKMSWDLFKRGTRCPYCCNRQVLRGYNDIYTTDRWMCDLGVSEEDAKTHTRCSKQKIMVICPNCCKSKEMQISQIYIAKSISCTCGDGISYPEKFTISLLDQLEVKYVKEYIPKWSCNKRYDFYLPTYDVIIECHGEQHYKQTNRKGARTLEEEQQNDKYKKELALENGISEYIVLDCRKSGLDWIKSSILQSELNNMFNLDKVDWVKCEEFALGNRVKEICDYWNNKEDWETTKSIGDKFNLSNTTIRKYLIKGQALNWCYYSPINENIKHASKCGKSNGKPIKMFKDNVCIGMFESAHELERQSKKLFNVKLNCNGICKVCRGEYKTHKGFTFKYISKEEYYELNKKY